ncbi:helix-turn-helix domain-containing protein [Clostridium cibarium]|uniref:Helix-turn-helix transcriptional regulator n=1 Tax=Clostridium cibarium TaxID=2762247 RepID=A0ABR8PPD4_9CLOT|nr:helix-turn-helix transcriptional regulator [Clostridium cibarium]MBD7910041.1 helix-turn-helix transcriptional regulator [Clostridium cibarium]
MDKRNIIGDNVKRLRKKQGLTQEELTAKLQLYGLAIDRPMLTKIELKKREVLDYELLCIAKAFNVSTEELFTKQR